MTAYDFPINSKVRYNSSSSFWSGKEGKILGVSDDGYQLRVEFVDEGEPITYILSTDEVILVEF